jgi:hypothetical protein
MREYLGLYIDPKKTISRPPQSCETSPLNLPKIRPQIIHAAPYFLRQLLCFEAKISASWQH